MNKQYQELQEYINIIITTAKLLDYKISHEKDSIYFTHPKNLFPVLRVALFIRQDTISLETSMNGVHKTFNTLPHEQKLSRLHDFLQHL